MKTSSEWLKNRIATYRADGYTKAEARELLPEEDYLRYVRESLESGEEIRCKHVAKSIAKISPEYLRGLQNDFPSQFLFLFYTRPTFLDLAKTKTAKPGQMMMVNPDYNTP